MLGRKRFDVNGPIGRLVQGAAAMPVFAPVAQRVMPPLDRALSRLTGGRFVFTQLLVPTIVLTTTGARSGLERTTALTTLPDLDGSFYVVGSNLGDGAHPDWSANLLKTPGGTVAFHGNTFEVEAHLLDEPGREAVWPRLRAVWPLYDGYVARSSRDLRVFRLVPRQPGAAGQGPGSSPGQA